MQGSLWVHPMTYGLPYESLGNTFWQFIPCSWGFTLLDQVLVTMTNTMTRCLSVRVITRVIGTWNLYSLFTNTLIQFSQLIEVKILMKSLLSYTLEPKNTVVSNILPHIKIKHKNKHIITKTNITTLFNLKHVFKF